MNKKVTLTEIVATKIIYALLIVIYYWMFARRDWHEYYIVIQNTVAVFTIVFFLIQCRRIHKFKKEVVDEMAQQNLHRANHVSLTILSALVLGIAFLGAMEILTNLMMGYALVTSILLITVVRAVMFYIMDTKGV